jgi:hypothetical protein
VDTDVSGWLSLSLLEDIIAEKAPPFPATPKEIRSLAELAAGLTVEPDAVQAVIS